jgi:peptidoglycan/xylan/chitin deacetylase (PgdA/CDA1 family)
MPITRIEIPYFPGDKRIALTTSWDDGTVHDRRLIAYFNQIGLKGTFNLNSAFLRRLPTDSPRHLERSEVAELMQGHEVAIHTLDHPHLPLIDASQIAQQVLQDRIELEEIVGYPVRGMAYPFGTYNPRVIELLRGLGIVYSRTTETTANPWPASEPLAWAATGHMFAEKDSLPMGQYFDKWYQNPRSRGLLFIWGHSYEFDQNDRWGKMAEIFGPMAGKADVWYCTNIALFDYEAARQRLILAANRRTAYNPSALPVTIKINNTKLVDIPAGTLVELEPYAA